MFLTFLTGLGFGTVIFNTPFGLLNGVVQILCKNYIYAGLSIVNGLLGLIPLLPITAVTSVPLLVYDSIKWWQEDSKRKDSELQKKLKGQFDKLEDKADDVMDQGIQKVSNKIN